MSKTRDQARSELAQYLKGTSYEITDPTEDTRTLEQRERQAQQEITLLKYLDPKGFRQMTRDDGRKVLLAKSNANANMARQLEREFGMCVRCNLVRTGECVNIVSGLTQKQLRIHLACVEDGDEFAD